MDMPPLFSLPAEVRANIYNLLLDEAPHIRLCGSRREHEATRQDPSWRDPNEADNAREIRITAKGLPLGALGTCRRLRVELLDHIRNFRLIACHRVVKAFPTQLLAAEIRARITDLIDENPSGRGFPDNRDHELIPCWCDYKQLGDSFPALRSMSACLVLGCSFLMGARCFGLHVKDGIWGRNPGGTLVREDMNWLETIQGQRMSKFIGACAECGEQTFDEDHEDAVKDEGHLKSWPSKIKVILLYARARHVVHPIYMKGQNRGDANQLMTEQDFVFTVSE
jgi:hypothetical protein